MNKFYKQIVLFLFICIILLLLTYLYTCVLNNKKESFVEYPSSSSDKCYPEYEVLQNCLNSDSSPTPPSSTPPSSTPPSSTPPSDHITIEEMIIEQVEKLETALRSLDSKQVFFNSKSRELRNLMNSGNWLSSELKEQLNSAIDAKQLLLNTYRTRITKITDELSKLKNNWNQSTFDEIVIEIGHLVTNINSLNIQPSSNI